MDTTITDFTIGLFKSHELHTVANLAYGHLLKGKKDALRLLSGYLVMRGCVVIIRGHEVRARSAATRSLCPPQLIFDLPGGDTSGVFWVAQKVAVNVNCKVCYLDKTASANLREMEERYVDGSGEDTPDRAVEEGAMLRN